MTAPGDRATERPPGAPGAAGTGAAAGVLAGRAADVLLPVHNERARLARSLEQVTRFAAEHPEYHFTFVDDGSTDGSPELIRSSLARVGLTNVELLAYTPRRGKGHAVRFGVERTGAPLVCFTDGDLAYSLDHLPPLLAALQDHDAVIGSRNRQDPAERSIRGSRWVMGWIFNRLARLVVGLPYVDTQAGLKGFRREAANRLFARQRVTGFGFDVEILHVARRLGYRVGEIPARVAAAHAREASQVDLLRDPVRMCRDLLAIRWNGYRGRYD